MKPALCRLAAEDNLALVPAVFVRRLNRFIVQVEKNGRMEMAHLPNSGRMEELLVAGAEIMVRPVIGTGRKTHLDFSLVRYEGRWVSVDSQLPNRLIHKALKEQVLSPFAFYDKVRKEYTYGESRLDFYLEGEGPPCLMEVKSVNLVIDGVALFPDAPTTRGARHLAELISARKEGYRSAVVFVIQREDAISFSPNKETDPHFALNLKKARDAGVEVYAYVCSVAPETGIVLKGEVNIRL